MSYTYAARRIAALKGAEVLGAVGAEHSRHPFYMIRRGMGMKILLLAGVHGDEPAGVESLIHFFESVSEQYEKDVEFVAFPCVNPWGFEHGRRCNAYGLNINREFRRDSPSEEVGLIQKHLRHYRVAIDLHETMKGWQRVGTNEPEGKDPEAFFMWETCSNKNFRVGKEIVRRVEEAGYRVCKWPKIYGDKNSGGVIWYPEGAHSACYATCDSSDSYLIKSGHVDQAFTIETPRKEAMSSRINMNMITIKTILESKMRHKEKKRRL